MSCCVLTVLMISDNGDLLLASSSQDTLIRVWRITQCVNHNTPDNDLKILQSTQGDFSIVYKEEFKFKSQLETVLQGHENWVYGLHWQAPIIKGIIYKTIITFVFSNFCYLHRWVLQKSAATTFLFHGQDHDYMGFR